MAGKKGKLFGANRRRRRRRRLKTRKWKREERRESLVHHYGFDLLEVCFFSFVVEHLRRKPKATL